MRFSLGVNYWPRRTAMAMWRRFDAGRFFLRWDDFQPQADAVDPVMLARLEERLPMISNTYYYRTLPTSIEAFLGFVRDRRGPHERRPR